MGYYMVATLPGSGVRDSLFVALRASRLRYPFLLASLRSLLPVPQQTVLLARFACSASFSFRFALPCWLALGWGQIYLQRVRSSRKFVCLVCSLGVFTGWGISCVCHVCACCACVRSGFFADFLHYLFAYCSAKNSFF